MSLGSARLVVSGTRAVYGRYPNKVLLEQAPEGYEEIQTKVRRTTCWRPALMITQIRATCPVQTFP